MSGFLPGLFVAMLLVVNVSAQDIAADAGPGSEELTTAGETAAAGAIGEAGEAEETEEVDDADLDDQTYAEDDDDFVPTEEIPADEAISFPTDI